MSDRQEKLKLQLPSHHLYDIEKEWSDAFEPPTSTFNIGPFVLQQQRRKLSKSASSRDAASASANFNNNSHDVIAMIPDTPPTTPDSNPKLYPFLRLHRQVSTSAPDVTELANIEEEESQQHQPQQQQQSSSTNTGKMASFEIGHHGYNWPNPPQSQLRTSASHGSALSEAIKGRGLTACDSMTSMDSLNNNNNNNHALEKSINRETNKMDQQQTTDPRFAQYHHQHHEGVGGVAKPLKRPSLSSGFLTNLIFGNKMFDGKPLKVSDFDMSMVAPGSM